MKSLEPEEFKILEQCSKKLNVWAEPDEQDTIVSLKKSGHVYAIVCYDEKGEYDDLYCTDKGHLAYRVHKAFLATL